MTKIEFLSIFSSSIVEMKMIQLDEEGISFFFKNYFPNPLKCRAV